MKKVIMFACMFCFTVLAMAQDNREEPTAKKGFQLNRMFVGASLGLGFSNGTFSIGANPEVGYSLTNWLDAGISTNINYISSRADYYNNYIRQRSTTYGGGVFMRVYPFRGLFLEALPEYNWIHSTAKQGTYMQTLNEEAPSFLAGIGYGGREVGRSGFFTVLMVDLGNNDASPYIYRSYDQNGNLYKSKLPILRSGFIFYLGQSRHEKYDRRSPRDYRTM